MFDGDHDFNRPLERRDVDRIERQLRKIRDALSGILLVLTFSAGFGFWLLQMAINGRDEEWWEPMVAFVVTGIIAWSVARPHNFPDQD